ncbi:glycosyltransferase family 2 protein [bacterium]|jgi:cellulose synthase/poly-beta-1,6-N-acetylglucosamine synthase-like glycosyltransferase|nr:glycosyltransferase family 2 protein [bacterium]
MNPEVKFLTDAMAVICFLITLSYYLLLLYKPKRRKADRSFTSLTVIVPAHNEQRYIEACLQSVIKAEFKGEKEIIVVDDGSTDATAEIVSRIKAVTLIRQPHRGKAATLNMAIARAKGELVAIIDGDTEIDANTLEEMRKDLEQEKTAGTTCPVGVKNRNAGLLMWLHVEALYASLLRSIMTKVNANIVNSGQCGMFRKEELVKCGGFSTLGLSEDMDIAIRLVRAGYHLALSEGTMAHTNMPDNFAWFWQQRLRWFRGNINIVRRHTRLNTGIIDLYSMPLVIYGYIQSFVMGGFTLYKIIDGYFTQVQASGQFLNWPIVAFLIDWVSAVGTVKWTFRLMTGAVPLTPVDLIGAIGSLLTYPLIVIAIVKYDKKFDINHIIPLLFMAPLWWLCMIVQVICIPELFNKKQFNIWTKPSFNQPLPAPSKAAVGVE